MRVLFLKTMSLCLNVIDERMIVVPTLSFLQIRMLVIINKFMVTHEQMCKQNVLIQMLYNEDQLASNHYSIFGW